MAPCHARAPAPALALPPCWARSGPSIQCHPPERPRRRVPAPSMGIHSSVSDPALRAGPKRPRCAHRLDVSGMSPASRLISPAHIPAPPPPRRLPPRPRTTRHRHPHHLVFPGNCPAASSLAHSSPCPSSSRSSSVRRTRANPALSLAPSLSPRARPLRAPPARLPLRPPQPPLLALLLALVLVLVALPRPTSPARPSPAPIPPRLPSSATRYVVLPHQSPLRDDESSC